MVQDSGGCILFPEFPGKEASSPPRETWVRPLIYSGISNNFPSHRIPSSDSLSPLGAPAIQRFTKS